MKVRKPILEQAPARKAAPERIRRGREGFFVGDVIFSRGNQMVAEVPRGAREGERFIVYDARLRRRGKATALKALEEGIYLLRPIGSYRGASGNQLSRESETEAVSRVLRENDLAAYQEFLELFPDSVHRPRVSREMFRVGMRFDYPTFPGTVIEGRVRLAEEVDREISLAQVLVVLDRFIIARTDKRGRFRIEGVPKVEEPVQLKLRVKDPKFHAADEVVLDLPTGEAFEEIEVELPVSVTPTVLAGRVVDERGAPLPGVEVWTSPYSMEVLTDEQGEYQLSRRKKTGAQGADQPLFGGDYEVYAYRKGYNVERAIISAESYQENAVLPIRLLRQDPREEEVPELELDLAAFLKFSPTASTEGAGPKINR
jgi:hypothetical protein